VRGIAEQRELAVVVARAADADHLVDEHVVEAGDPREQRGGGRIRLRPRGAQRVEIARVERGAGRARAGRREQVGPVGHREAAEQARRGPRLLAGRVLARHERAQVADAARPHARTEVTALAHARVHAVRADHEVGASRLEARVGAQVDAPVGVGGDQLAAEAQRDPRLGFDRVEQRGLQIRAAQHDDARRRRGREQGPAPPVDDPRAGHRTRGGLDRRAEAEALEHGEPVLGERDPGADRARLRDLLEDGHPRTGAREQ